MYNIIYKFQVYNTVITTFKGYIPFIVIIKYWLYTLCCLYTVSDLTVRYL